MLIPIFLLPFQERIVHIKREKVGGLGLSVKGGAEHNLPILVSRIFKDQAGENSSSVIPSSDIILLHEYYISATGANSGEVLPMYATPSVHMLIV